LFGPLLEDTVKNSLMAASSCCNDFVAFYDVANLLVGVG
jgi:hypothetical protein